MQRSVTIETSLGTEFTVSFLPWDTFLDLKKKIQQQQGFPVCNQILCWNNQPFPDHEFISLSDCTRIHLHLNVQLTIHFGNNVFLLPFPATASVPDLKKAISAHKKALDKVDYSYDCIALYIDDVELKDTYKFFGYEKLLLTVFLKSRLTLHIFRTKIPFNFYTKELVYKFKKAIADEFALDISINRIKLFVNGTEEMSGNHIALEDYGLGDCGVVRAAIEPLPIKLMVKILGSDEPPHVVHIDANETVLDLKTRMSKTLRRPRGLISVFIDFDELQETKVLATYRVTDGTTLKIMVYSELTIRADTKTFNLLHCPTVEKIGRLKERIADEIKVHVGRLILNVDRNEQSLQDDKTLASYGVVENRTVLNVTMKPMTRVKVMSMCGKRTIEVEVEESDKIEMLRSVLKTAKEKDGFPLPENYLFMNDQMVVLGENLTFRQNGLVDGGVIEVGTVNLLDMLKF